MSAAAEVVPGAAVQVTLRDGSKCSGIVVVHDAKQRVLVLEEEHPQSTILRDMRFVNLDQVESASVVAPASAQPHDAVYATATVDAARKREQDAFAKEEAALKRIGKGVSSEAQEFFDRLSKIHTEITWKGKAILETRTNIIIDPPYRPEDCKGEDANALTRLRQVVQGIRQKMATPPA